MTSNIQNFNQIRNVDNFEALVCTPFMGEVNALCWSRKLKGDFAEIVDNLYLEENLRVITEDDLNALVLSPPGQMARDILLNDLKLLTDYGADPVLNLIRNYERDDPDSVFPTDVYSFHVDRSPVPTDTFLCTYYGDASDILPNSEAIQKILIPEIRVELKKLFDGKEEDFESFLSENFFDLHYQATAEAQPINLGLGNLWRLATDHPESPVLPCVHRAPRENTSRLLLIC